MSVPLAQQAQELLGQSAGVIITERVDDVALLLGHMGTRGFVEGLDRPRPRHGKPRRVSWGWTAVMWLASLLTEGDQRKVSVEASSTGLPQTLSPLSGQPMAPLDGRDDRWGPLLTHVSPPTSWHASAPDGPAWSMEASDVSQDVSRGEATTVSGAHAVTDGGLGPCGQSTDDPTRPQSPVLMGAWAPVGRPRATAGLSGARAAEGVDIPLIERSEARVPRPACLGGGAGKRSALATRAEVAGRQHVSLAPFPLTGTTAAALEAWIPEGRAPDRDGVVAQSGRVTERGHEGRAAEGSAWARTCGREVGAAPWSERVVVRSPAHAARQARGLAQRLTPAEHTLAALTPAPGRGTRPIHDEATLVEAMAHVRKAPRVDG